MGLVNSHLQRKREILINQVDTLNKSLEFLSTLEKKNQDELVILEQNKSDIMTGIQRMDTIVKHRKREYLKTKDVMECTICMENKVNCVLIPCGHLYCSNCVISGNTCPHCRDNFSSIQKLFFV
jgi:late competence protein required for DNA uptake (superfamily II DNA/RNA helicase)